MGYYSGRMVIHNETDTYKDTKEHGLIATLKFSANFNKKKLYLNNTILNQILDSGAVQTYILKECSNYFETYKNEANNAINKILYVENFPNIKIQIIGKYFYIKFYCGRNHTLDDCLEALNKKLKKEKDKIEILRG